VVLVMVPGLFVVLAVRLWHQPVWWQTTTSVSLLGQAEVHEDVVVPRRVVLLLPLRHANSDHLVRLEVKAIQVSQLMVSPTPPSMVAFTILPNSIGARTPTTKTTMMFRRSKKRGMIYLTKLTGATTPIILHFVSFALRKLEQGTQTMDT
jgi:hypothetical protein